MKLMSLILGVVAAAVATGCATEARPVDKQVLVGVDEADHSVTTKQMATQDCCTWNGSAWECEGVTSCGAGGASCSAGMSECLGAGGQYRLCNVHGCYVAE